MWTQISEEKFSKKFLGQKNNLRTFYFSFFGFFVELKGRQRTLEICYFQECGLIPCFVTVLDILITPWAVKHNYCSRTAIMHGMRRTHVCHWGLCVYTLDIYSVLFLFNSLKIHTVQYIKHYNILMHFNLICKKNIWE